MKKQAKKPFDQSTIPNDLCPIATEYSVLKTGDWRARRPVVDRERCVKCATCWLYCPTQCVGEKPRWFEANLEICKGCGVCAQECPHHAIDMVTEGEEAEPEGSDPDRSELEGSEPDVPEQDAPEGEEQG